MNTAAIHFLSKQTTRSRHEKGITVTASRKLEILLNLCTGEQVTAYELYFEINSTRRAQLAEIKARLDWLLQQITDRQNLKYQKALDDLTTIQQYQDHQEGSQSDQQQIPNVPSEDNWNECLEILGSIVLNLINSFPANDALILKLRYLDGLTLEKIGRIIGKAKGQISRDLQRLEPELLEKLAIFIPEDPEKKEKCEQCLKLLTLPAFFKELAKWLQEENNTSQDQEGNEQ